MSPVRGSRRMHLVTIYYACIIWPVNPTGSADDCLQLLSQRTTGVGSLQTLQSAVLVLFYYVLTHVDDDQWDCIKCVLLYCCWWSCVDWVWCQKVIFRKLCTSTFLSLNPNIHLLPPTIITHLTVLYVQVCVCVCVRTLPVTPSVLQVFSDQQYSNSKLYSYPEVIISYQPLTQPHRSWWEDCRSSQILRSSLRPILPYWSGLSHKNPWFSVAWQERGYTDNNNKSQFYIVMSLCFS